MSTALTQTNFPDLKLVHRGKVRDLYEIDNQLLMVATDRISAYDVVMNEPIPDKGRVLTSLSRFWFERLAEVVPHHLVTGDHRQVRRRCATFNFIQLGVANATGRNADQYLSRRRGRIGNGCKAQRRAVLVDVGYAL